MYTHAQFIGVEAGGPRNSKLHAAPLTYGLKLVFFMEPQYVIQDKEGQIGSTGQYLQVLITWNFSSSLFLKDAKRARYTSASDEEALKAYNLFQNLKIFLLRLNLHMLLPKQ